MDRDIIDLLSIFILLVGIFALKVNEARIMRQNQKEEEVKEENQ